VTAIPAEYFRRLAAAWEFLKPYVDDGREETLLKLLNETGFIAMPQVRAMLRNTVSLNGLHSGDKVNVIPSYAEAEVDTRLLPGQDVDAWLKEVKTLLDDDEIEIETLSTYPGNSSDMDTADYRLIEQALSHHYPGAVTAPYLMLGTTDSRFFRDRGITSYGFCPAVIPMEHMKSIHGFDEKISVDSFLKGVEVYKDILLRLCAD
jgi:carboxypeptidase PM20D1